MFAKLFSSIAGRDRATRPKRARLARARWPAAVYAIGDVHGCIEQLQQLEAMIVADSRSFFGRKLIVMIGDYVDRGPQCAQVISHLLTPPPMGFERICLAGNHEQIMLDMLDGDGDIRYWLNLGAEATLSSYGLDARRLLSENKAQRRALLRAHIPDEHRGFLETLPVSFSLPGAIFVHAGTRVGVALDDQPDSDLMWMRPGENHDVGRTELLVHGHTPGDRPVDTPLRICVDTAAYATGRLTAVRLLADGPRRFLTT